MILCMWTMPVPAPSPGDDAQLDRCIAGVAAGEREALAELYEKTHRALYGFALSILKNSHDAEDVLQDAYVQVWRGAAGYRGQGKPMAWLLTITRNLSVSRLREAGRTQPLTPEEWERQPYRSDAVTAEDRMALAALMTALGDEERQIITLHVLSGLKHREIGDLLGLPLPTVLSKYHRALKKLRLAWKEADQHA